MRLGGSSRFIVPRLIADRAQTSLNCEDLRLLPVTQAGARGEGTFSGSPPLKSQALGRLQSLVRVLVWSRRDA
jgi:hypothetical protein